MGAQGSTFITYGNNDDMGGGITLYRVVTSQIHQEPVLDESHTDLMYYKTTIRGTGFLHGHSDWNYLGQTPVVSDGLAASAHKAVRYQLPPRQRFKMTVGATENVYPALDGPGDVMFDVKPAPLSMIPPFSSTSANINLTGLDVTNGPRCLDFSVTQLTPILFRVDFEFEINQVWCAQDGTVPSNTYGILSNRWSVQDSLDHNLRTTRTYSGVMVLASANLNAQMLRWVLAPPLQPLFRRDHMDFRISPDGLRYQWTVTDVEIAISAPFPARKWSIEHTIGSMKAQMGSSRISMYLEGDAVVNKSDLIEICFYIITNRIFGLNPRNLGNLNNADGYIVEKLELTDHIGDVNAISAVAEVSHKVDAAGDLGWTLKMGNFGTTITAFDQGNPNADPPLPPQPIMPKYNDGTNGGVGGNPPYNQPTGQQYNPSISWGGYLGQVPTTEGWSKAIGVFVCFLQTPCDDNHGAYKPGYTVPSQNSGTRTQPTRVSVTPNASMPTATSQNPVAGATQSTYLYRFWQIDNVIKRRSMKKHMPIASGSYGPYSTTSLVLQLAPTQVVQIIRVHGERLGDWPEFFDPNNPPAWPTQPSPPDGYVPIVRTYLTHRVKPGTPTYTINGAKIFRATMEIVLALSREPTPEELINLGTDKWTNQGPQSTGPTLTNGTW